MLVVISNFFLVGTFPSLQSSRLRVIYAYFLPKCGRLGPDSSGGLEDMCDIYIEVRYRGACQMRVGKLRKSARSNQDPRHLIMETMGFGKKNVRAKCNHPPPTLNADGVFMRVS